MATGTTVVISTAPSTSDPVSATASDAGTPTAGTVQFIYDDAATQSELVKAANDFIAYVLRAVTKV